MKKQCKQKKSSPLFHASVDEFVRDRLVHLYKRKVGPQNDGRYRWVAVHRRQDGATGMSTWWRDHADHHMPILLDPEGPFNKSTDRNNHGDPLPHTPPPEGFFPDMREA